MLLGRFLLLSLNSSILSSTLLVVAIFTNSTSYAAEILNQKAKQTNTSQPSSCGEDITFSGTAPAYPVLIKYFVDKSPDFQSSINSDSTSYSNRISLLGKVLGINSSSSQDIDRRASRTLSSVQLKPHQVLYFDRWTYGDNVNNIYLPHNLRNERWLKIQGTNTWVPNGVIKGNPPSSPSALRPFSCLHHTFIHGLVSSQNNSNQIAEPDSHEESNAIPTESNPLQGFSNPLKTSIYITQGPNGKYSHHGRSRYAIDLNASIGTPVYAMHSGKVVFLRDVYQDTGGGSENAGTFNTVVIAQDNGYRSAYLHLERGFIQKVGIHEGDQVVAGQLIGYSGNSGWSTGPHLHVEVHQGFFGQTVPFEIDGVFHFPR